MVWAESLATVVVGEGLSLAVVVGARGLIVVVVAGAKEITDAGPAMAVGAYKKVSIGTA